MLDWITKLFGKKSSYAQGQKLVKVVAVNNEGINKTVTKSTSFISSMLDGLTTAENQYTAELDSINTAIDALVAQREQVLNNITEVRQFRINIRGLSTPPVLQGNTKPTITVTQL